MAHKKTDDDDVNMTRLKTCLGNGVKFMDFTFSQKGKNQKILKWDF